MFEDLDGLPRASRHIQIHIQGQIETLLSPPFGFFRENGRLRNTWIEVLTSLDKTSTRTSNMRPETEENHYLFEVYLPNILNWNM